MVSYTITCITAMKINCQSSKQCTDLFDNFIETQIIEQTKHITKPVVTSVSNLVNHDLSDRARHDLTELGMT